MAAVPIVGPSFVDLVRATFDYDDHSGQLIWRRRAGARVVLGATAGTLNRQIGYLVVRLAGRLHYVHRLVWLHVYGNWPADQIDHIDRDKTNNRLHNLRQATNAQNRQNMPVQRNNTSGCSGVYFHKQRGKWAAEIKHNRKKRHLGLFCAKEDAVHAYQQAKRALHAFGAS